MKRLKSIFLVVLATAVTTGYLIAVIPPIDTTAQGSAALSITPRKNYTVEPGRSVNDTLIVRNLDSEHPLNLNLRVVDFTFTDDGGTPQLMLDEDAPQTTWSMKPFLEIPETVSIEPRGSETLDMSVAIPEGHGAGSYYSAIVYSTGAAEGGNVGLSASGVTLVFTQIPGDVEQQLTIENLGAYDQATREYSYFNTTEPTRIAYTLKNEGNVTESPVGSITLRDLFGRETVINDINPNQSLALIGQTRTFESCIMQRSEEVDFSGGRSEATVCTEAGLWPGFYRVELAGFYGQNGNNTEELNGTASFWYLPWWFIIISLLVLSYVAYRIWRIVRYIRNRKSNRTPKGAKKKQTRRRK